MKRFATILFAALLLGACAITNAPGGVKQGGFVAKDLLAAKYNLDQAIAIGVLPEDDPAASCIDDVLVDLGLDANASPDAVQSFDPKRDGLISEGAVIYIRAQQLKKIKEGRIVLPQACKAVIGQIVIDAARVAHKGLRSLIPGSGLISIIRGR